MPDMRSAARLLLLEGTAIRPVLDALEPEAFDLPTVCVGWSVRDVLGHCGAALSRLVGDDLHGFGPSDNEADVVLRRRWPLEEVLEELIAGYVDSVDAIDQAGGRFDGIGLGEWVHGGDIREAVGAQNPYTSEGVKLAFDLLLERSAGDPVTHGQTSRAAVEGKPVIEVDVDGVTRRFGGNGRPVGTLTTDLETFVRLATGRPADAARYHLNGADPQDLALFN
jgi:uncharacterized protein (TIGR03083 family)